MRVAQGGEILEEGFGRLVHVSLLGFGSKPIRAVALIGLWTEHVAPGEILGRRLPGSRLEDVAHLELAHVLRHDEGVGGAVGARGPVPISHHHAQVFGTTLKGDRHVVAARALRRRGALLFQRIGVGRQREVEVVRGSEGLGHLCLLDHVLSIGRIWLLSRLELPCQIKGLVPASHDLHGTQIHHVVPVDLLDI